MSDKPDDGYGFPTIARDLAAFVDALSLERPVSVGHSWGASVALQHTVSRPVGPGAPSAIVLVDGGYVQLNSQPGMTWEKAEAQMRPPPLAGTKREEFVERGRRMFGNPAWLTPQAVEIVLGNFEILPDDTIWSLDFGIYVFSPPRRRSRSANHRRHRPRSPHQPE